MFGLFKKKKQTPPPEPKPLKTKDVELTHIHIGQVGNAFTVLAEDVERLKKAAHAGDDFIEIWTYMPYNKFGAMSFGEYVDGLNVFQIFRLVEINPCFLILIESPKFAAKLLDE